MIAVYAGILHTLLCYGTGGLQCAGFAYHIQHRKHFAMAMGGWVGFNWGFFQYWQGMNNDTFNIWMANPNVVLGCVIAPLLLWKMWDPELEQDLNKDQMFKKKMQGFLRGLFYVGYVLVICFVVILFIFPLVLNNYHIWLANAEGVPQFIIDFVVFGSLSTIVFPLVFRSA